MRVTKAQEGFAIQEFFSYSDFAFPGTKMTIKMHILEMHIIEWMSTYNAGLGLMGEQGTEAIHAHFKQSCIGPGRMAVWQTKCSG